MRAPRDQSNEEPRSIASTVLTAAPEQPDPPDPARTGRSTLGGSWLLPVSLYLAVLAAVVLATWVSISLAPPRLDYIVRFRGDGLLGGLSRYDGGWYELISRRGYRDHAPGVQSPVAFFPGYPLAMRALGPVVGDNALAGILVTAGSGLGVAVLFWRWCRERMDRAAATTSLLALLLYPYGYYLYGVLYADALFVFATLLAFWAVERDRPVLAGLAGAVATFTRPVGIAVAVGLVVRTLERRGSLGRPGWLGVPTRLRRGILRPGDGWVLISVGGLGAYMLYLWSRFGDPRLFSAVQEHWGQPSTPRTWLKVAFSEQLRYYPDSWFTWGLLVQAFLALAALAMVPLVGRRFGWGYAAYLGAVLLVPLVGTKDFQGLGRYCMAAFPAFAVLGQILTHRPLIARYVVLPSAAVLLVAASAAFAHGYYIS